MLESQSGASNAEMAYSAPMPGTVPHANRSDISDALPRKYLAAINAHAVCAAEAVSQNKLGGSSSGSSGTWGMIWKKDYVPSSGDCVSQRSCEPACVAAGWTGAYQGVQYDRDDALKNAKDTESHTFFDMKFRHSTTTCNDAFCCCYE